MVEPKLRVVFDTNIYIAAAIRQDGSSSLWIDTAAKSDPVFELYTSEEIIAEVSEKLSEKFGFSNKKVEVFVERLKRAARVVRPIQKVNVITADPDDNMIIECALAAQAHLVVSADPHVFKLKNYEGIAFVHPRQLKYLFRQDEERAA